MASTLIELTNKEKYFLRLMALNYDDEFIAQFLSLEKKDLSYVKCALKRKFNTKDWSTLIQEAFELGILRKQDYVDTTVKKIAMGYASKIIYDFKNVSFGYKFPQDALLDFDHAVTASLKRLKFNLK